MLLKRATIIATIVSGVTFLIASGVMNFVINENNLKKRHNDTAKGFDL